MKRNRLILAIVVAITALEIAIIGPLPSPATASSDGVVDQEQPIIDSSVGGSAVGGQSNQKLAQVVTAGMTANLTAVRFPVACSFGSLTVEIRSTNAGAPTGELATSETKHAVNFPSFGAEGPSFREIALSNPVSMSSGTQFAIVLTSDGECGVFRGPEGDPYPRGDGWFFADENNRWVPLGNPRFDLPFQTLVSTAGGTATPMPSESPNASPSSSPGASPSASPSPSQSVSPSMPPDSSTDISYERVITLRLRHHLVAKGRIDVPNGSADCAVEVPVKIKRRAAGKWSTVASTFTSFEGAYKTRLRDRPGVYRAVAVRTELVSDAGTVTCIRDGSVRRRHAH